MPPNPTLDVQIRDVRSPATDILTLSLGRPSGAALPRWQPGAHVDIHLPSGAVRQYSLHSAPGDRRTYEISVLRVADGRGGSAFPATTSNSTPRATTSLWRAGSESPRCCP
jgi:ferredoxin-NADP reductase